MVKAAEKVVNGEGKWEHAFGHLIILLRDVTGTAVETEAFVMGIEDTEDLSFEAAKDGAERNLIRTTLKKAFESITFHTMPSPHANIGRECPRVISLRAFSALIVIERVLTVVSRGVEFAGHELERAQPLTSVFTTSPCGRSQVGPCPCRRLRPSSALLSAS